MANIVKKVSGPYKIEAQPDAKTQVTIGMVSRNDAELIVNGNLTVFGTQTTINSTNTDLVDNIITLNAGVDANIAPIADAGITVNRGSSPSATLLWNETTDTWQINDGATVKNIATSTGTGFLTNVVEDLSPQLGGALDVNGFSITSLSNINLTPTTAVNIVDVPLTITTPSEATTIAAGSPLGGATGLYVTTLSNSNPSELITKRKAIVYSIIF